MMYLRAGLTALSAAGLLTKLLTAAGVLAALLALYGVWHHQFYQRGVDDAVARIARNDARLVARAVAARAKLKDCQIRGMSWDQTTGACR
jgi:hypothetical protein